MTFTNKNWNGTPGFNSGLKCEACGDELDVHAWAKDFACPKDQGILQKQPSPIDVDEVLQERGERYGSFEGHAEITQLLKTVISVAADKRNTELADDQQEALDMICHKIGRIINGDPDYADSWIDIAGYAKLVADRLQNDEVSAG